MTDHRDSRREALRYLGWVLVFSLPFWLLGSVSGTQLGDYIPANLPISALMAVCPLLAVLAIAGAERRRLVQRAFDWKRIPWLWFVPALLLMPVVTLAGYGLAGKLSWLVEFPAFSPAVPALLFAVFLVSAACEEVGWQGYLYPRIERMAPAGIAAAGIGALWAVWHIVPYFQGGHDGAWVFWQCLNTVALRILIVWVYLNARRSVFAAVLTHATINLAVFLTPDQGASFDPATAAIASWLTVGVIAALWEPRTLNRFRFQKSSPRAR